MKTLLSIETSSETGSWAVLQNEKILFSETFHQRASASFFPSLQKHAEKFPRIDQILVGVGPGSFSGIRVAIAAAEGFRLAWNCEIIPVRSSDAIAYQHADASFLGVFAQARREEHFVTYYECGKLARPTQLLPAAELENHLGKCSFAASAEKILGIKTRTVPTATHLALSYLKNGAEKNLPLEPIYLSPPVKPLPS